MTDNRTTIRQINAGAKLELPFKPFTLDEVQALTGATSKVMDRWVGKILMLHTGCGVEGLSYMQTFGLYCAGIYLLEGSGEYRAVAVMRMVAGMQHETMLQELKAGRTFPVPSFMDPAFLQRGVMVHAPNNRLGNRLNLRTLYEEFLARMEKVFPKG